MNLAVQLIAGLYVYLAIVTWFCSVSKSLMIVPVASPYTRAHIYHRRRNRLKV